ncbi:serine protease [Patescibacteria group bacterium]|nr:serine protease [Patescibacteria group bacterium]
MKLTSVIPLIIFLAFISVKFNCLNRPLPINPYPFSVVIIIEENNIPHGQASGFIYDNKKGLIATAGHVIEEGKKPGYSFKIHIDDHQYEAFILWKHQTAEIGLLQIKKLETTFLNNSLPQTLFSTTLPAIGDSLTLIGFKPADLENDYCLPQKVHGYQICQQEIPMVIELVDARSRDVSLPMAINEMQELIRLKKENPDLNYEDIFYTKHLVANPTDRNFKTENTGLSGGVLIDQQGLARAIFWGDNGKRYGFVSLREIPQEYNPQN